MDEMLRGLYLDTATHADDIRSLLQTITAVQNQASTLSAFTISHGLKRAERVALLKDNCILSRWWSASNHKVILVVQCNRSWPSTHFGTIQEDRKLATECF